jgi:hypothetical protein
MARKERREVLSTSGAEPMGRGSEHGEVGGTISEIGAK